MFFCKASAGETAGAFFVLSEVLICMKNARV